MNSKKHKEHTRTQRLLTLVGKLCVLAGLALVTQASAKAPGDLQFEREDQSAVASFPPSIFPHWIHRINYRCDACHDRLFKMQLGATPITMDLIAKGEVCGACHNGERAFDDGFTNCTRCHRAPSD